MTTYCRIAENGDEQLVAVTEVAPGVVHITTEAFDLFLRDAGWEPVS